jgi:hypothetical protein
MLGPWLSLGCDPVGASWSLGAGHAGDPAHTAVLPGGGAIRACPGKRLTAGAKLPMFSTVRPAIRPRALGTP